MKTSVIAEALRFLGVKAASQFIWGRLGSVGLSRYSFL
jgi:hypothetical protein